MLRGDLQKGDSKKLLLDIVSIIVIVVAVDDVFWSNQFHRSSRAHKFTSFRSVRLRLLLPGGPVLVVGIESQISNRSGTLMKSPTDEILSLAD